MTGRRQPAGWPDRKAPIQGSPASGGALEGVLERVERAVEALTEATELATKLLQGATLQPLTVSEQVAARRLGGIGVSTVRKLAVEGELVKLHIGTRALISTASIDAYVARRIAAERGEGGHGDR